MSGYPNALANHVIEVERRRAGRADVSFETLMCDRTNAVFSAAIHNMSLTGMMATTDAQLCERDPVRLDLPTIGWVRADIVWVLGNKVGAKFRVPIREHELDLFQERYG